MALRVAGENAIRKYKDYALFDDVKPYQIINGSLKKKFYEGTPIENKTLKIIKDLDEVFVNVASRSKDVVTVFRGGYLFQQTRYTPEFISTSTNVHIAKSFGKLMEIKIRPGTPYLVIMIENDEREILLPRGVFFKKLGITNIKTESLHYQAEQYEAYLPKYDPNDPINIKMETPHYNKYYDEVCKDFYVLEVDTASEKSPKRGNRKSNKKSSSGTSKSGASKSKISKGSRKKPSK